MDTRKMNDGLKNIGDSGGMSDVFRNFYMNSATPDDLDAQRVNQNLLKQMDKEDFEKLRQSAADVAEAVKRSKDGSAYEKFCDPEFREAAKIFAPHDALDRFWECQQKMKNKYKYSPRDVAKRHPRHFYPQCDYMSLRGGKFAYAKILLKVMNHLAEEMC